MKTKLFALLTLMVALSVHAGPITTITNALNGGTNFVNGSSLSNYFVPRITTTIYTNPAIQLSNGVSVALSQNITNTSTNIPGLLDLSRFDEVEVCASFAGAAAGVVSNLASVTFYKTIDGTTNNAYPAFTLTPGSTNGVNGGTYAAGTNYHIGGAYGLIAWSVSNAGTNSLTNLTVQAAGKSIRSGP